MVSVAAGVAVVPGEWPCHVPATAKIRAQQSLLPTSMPWNHRGPQERMLASASAIRQRDKIRMGHQVLRARALHERGISIRVGRLINEHTTPQVNGWGN